MSEKLRKEFNAIYNQLFKDFKIYKNADLRKAFRCLKDEAYKIINHSLTLRADLDRKIAENERLQSAFKKIGGLMGLKTYEQRLMAYNKIKHSLPNLAQEYVRLRTDLERVTRERDRTREAFENLLQSHGWFTQREYENDPTYNDSSPGYKAEEKAVEVFRDIFGDQALATALAAVKPETESPSTTVDTKPWIIQYCPVCKMATKHYDPGKILECDRCATSHAPFIIKPIEQKEV